MSTFIPGLSQLLEQPDPPCEEFRCKFFSACKRDLLACAAFSHYVKTGNVVARENWPGDKTPSHRRYLVIFPPKEAQHVNSNEDSAHGGSGSGSGLDRGLLHLVRRAG